MNRCIIPIMGFALITAFSAPAQAVTGKWCFKWGVDYDDSGAGEDYVLTTRPARYTYVTIYGPSTCEEYFLDSGGCTPDTTIAPSTTYTFTQYTRAKRGTRDVYVLADNESWSSTNAAYVSWPFTTGSSIQNGYTKTFGYPGIINDQIRIMPAVGNTLYFANTLAWEDGNDLKISFDLDCRSNNPIESSCHYRPSGSSTSRISLTRSDLKFHVAHEMGHMIATINQGPAGGDNTGSEGMFRDPTDGRDPPDGDGTHNCDSTLLENENHNLTSREFVGNATGEGWAQFIAAAAYNDPADVTGRFVYGYKRIMKWDSSHDGALCWQHGAACLPTWDTFSNTSSGLDYWDHPHVVPLDTGDEATDFTRWIEEECNPASGTFQHYGTEWDWLNFFWNLWVDASDPISVADIADVWDTVPSTDVAYFCCNAWQTSCIPDDDGVCPTFPNPYIVQHEIGKLWTDDSAFYVNDSVREYAQAKFGAGSGKYNLFNLSGQYTRVNY